jgi:hypothetical protein
MLFLITGKSNLDKPKHLNWALFVYNSHYCWLRKWKTLLESEVIMAGWKFAFMYIRMLESESCSKSMQVDVPTKGWGLGGGVHLVL